MNTGSVKKAVIDTYGKLAKSKQHAILPKISTCCKSSDTPQQLGEEIGYSMEELNSAPEASNLGVGCGNPSALSKIQTGDTVIDLGSGAGFDAFLVSPIVGKSGLVIGVDLSDEMLSLATSNAKKGNYSNVKFIKGDIEELPLDDQVADYTISNCVINLSLNKQKVFNEAFRVLKSGGGLLVSDIVLEKELPDFLHNSLTGHIACISGTEKLNHYLQYVEDAGFSNVQVVDKKIFPLELVFTDPQVAKIATELNFTLDSAEAQDIASRISSISISADKQ
ncbi:MAG: arsenite methyltransferase [Cyclobacteriaceae bacterium]